jgi:hypothetical protein
MTKLLGDKKEHQRLPGETIRERPGRDVEINRAKIDGTMQVSTSAFDQDEGFLGMDDIDRIRREKLKHETR